MDAILEPLWQSGMKPFHDETIYPTRAVFVREATVAMQSALDHISQYYPDTKLFAFDDWHEHDGFLVSAQPTTIEVLREQVSSPTHFVSDHSDDFAVYRAVYPEGLDFLLRYSLSEADEPDQDDSDREVHWTFSGYGHDLAEMKKRWATYDLASDSSSVYFSKRYAG